MTSTNPAPKPERNYGIDLLRLLSMFFVVLLHALLLGGLLDHDAAISPHKAQAAWLLEILAYGAVDTFALISGYVGFRAEKRPFKFKPIFSLWSQAVFYGLATFVFCSLFRPRLVEAGDLFTHLLPVSHGYYWYLTAYIGLLFLTPLLNAAVRDLSERQCHTAIFAALGLFSVFAIFSGDKFVTSGGYSIWWLAVLYFIGAALKKSNLLTKINKRWCLFGIFACALLTWTLKIFGSEFVLFDFKFGPDFLVSYLSPTIVISAILYLRLFSSLKLRPSFIKLIKWFAPCAFAVYLLNCNPHIQRFYPAKFLGSLTSASTPVTILTVLGFSLGFFVVALLVEKLRQTAVAFLNHQLPKPKPKTLPKTP